MSEIERKAIEAALRKMFQGSYFDICTIDKCLALLGVSKGGKTYQILSTLHCVSYADMDRELAQAVPGMIGEVLNGFSMDFGPVLRGEQAQAADVVPPKRGILRMLGR